MIQNEVMIINLITNYEKMDLTAYIFISTDILLDIQLVIPIATSLHLYLPCENTNREVNRLPYELSKECRPNYFVTRHKKF